MGAFAVWWQSLGLIGQIMACAAIPMTIVMFLQLIMMIIGAGFGVGADHNFDSHGSDFNMDHSFDAHGPGFDAGHDVGGHDMHIGDGAHGGAGHAHVHSDAARIFTIRGIVAFFAIGGWAGLAALAGGIPALWSLQIALISGVAAMLLASVVIRFALRMQSTGNIDLKNAVLQNADVYITIPPSRTNTGKVTMILQERFVELDAVTDSPEALKPNTKVEVVDTTGKDCLVVRAVAEEQKEAAACSPV